MRRYYTLDDARRIDKLIFDLAFYEITQGLIPTEVNQDSMVSLHKEATEKFNYFKKLIKSGEYSLSELERDIVDRYCAIPSQKPKFDLEQIDKVVDEWEKEEEEKEKYEAQLKKGSDSIMGMVNSLLGGSGAFEIPLDSSQDQLEDDENYDGDEFNDEDEDGPDWGWK